MRLEGLWINLCACWSNEGECNLSLFFLPLKELKENQEGDDEKKSEEEDEEKEKKAAKVLKKVSVFPACWQWGWIHAGAAAAVKCSYFSQGRKRKRSVSADSGEGSVSDSDSSHSEGEDKEEDDEDKAEDDADGTILSTFEQNNKSFYHQGTSNLCSNECFSIGRLKKFKPEQFKDS